MPVNNKRIAINTLMLYFRMFIMILISLYTSRVVLKALGISDFGIYNVVGGIVTMFAFLNSSMAAATQRYFSFDLGKENGKQLDRTFNLSLQIHAVIALILAVLIEGIGSWLLTHKMTIPNDRIFAAQCVLHTSMFTLLLSVIQIPYRSLIIAYEKMSIYAYLGIIEAAIKLLIAFSLTWNYKIDKLILYTFLMCGSSIIQFLFNYFYCRKNFSIKYHLEFNKQKSLEMISYATWNLSAHFALMARTQGVNLLLNIFFGPTINAARAVAVQIAGNIQSFMQNFQVAVNPQIIKEYAAERYDNFLTLIYNSSKYSFLLLYLLVLPVVAEAEYIINVWLQNPPDHAIIFCRLSLIAILIDALSGTLVYGALATGRIKKYQLIVSAILLINPLTTYIALKLGLSANSVYIIEGFFYLIALQAKLILLNKLINLSIKKYYKDVILKCILICIIPIIPVYYISQILPSNFFRVIIITTISSLIILLSTYVIGLSSTEKQKITQSIKKQIKQYL